MFSNTAIGFHGNTNPLYDLREVLLRQNKPLTDLISANLNERGYIFPAERLEDILVQASRRCMVYSPDSFGQRCAREAVSDYYRNRCLSFDPDNILLTPGTSISYWYCFKLLADEGEEILCPRPSYPLFDYIARLSGIRLIPYRLDETKKWGLDVDFLESAISTKTRAVVLISPHNPTGGIATSDELDRLGEVAARHDLAIINDEVFSEFMIGNHPLPSPASGRAPLVFTLNGFSKMYALPGMKLGWIAVSGEEGHVRRAMRFLELMSDTFLPVNEIVQAAVPDIFNEGAAVCSDFADRIRKCWEVAEHCLDSSECFSFIKPRGGFYVTLKLDGVEEEKAALYLMEKHQILVHPGYFYDMNDDHLVLSYVQNPETMQRASAALKDALSDLYRRRSI